MHNSKKKFSATSIYWSCTTLILRWYLP